MKYRSHIEWNDIKIHRQYIKGKFRNTSITYCIVLLKNAIRTYTKRINTKRRGFLYSNRVVGRYEYLGVTVENNTANLTDWKLEYLKIKGLQYCNTTAIYPKYTKRLIDPSKA